MAQPEHNLQVQIKKFVRECGVGWHKFAAHDRSKKQSMMQHVREKDRGLVKGWLDTELLWDGGRTFRCEIKKPEGKPDPVKDEAQLKLIDELNQHGHPAAWVNSIVGYLAAARSAGVTFHPNADLRALDLDLVLKGAAMKATGKAPRSYKPRTAKPTLRQVARTNALRSRVMF